MKTILLTICMLALAAVAYIFQTNEHKRQEEFVDNSSQIIKQLASGLKQELKTAIQAKGVAAAIQTCKLQAPLLTDKVSNSSPLIIKRTSLKLRNPANTPDAWEQQVLMDFEQQLAQGATIDQLVHTEVVKNEGKKIYRHMRAILTQPICLTCHGDQKILSTEVKSMLNKEYPGDRAIGFNVGELRGAFSVSQITQK